jgi:hypothetical protein
VGAYENVRSEEILFSFKRLLFMQIDRKDLIVSILKFILEPLFKYNPFFTLYYNPFSDPPGPEIPRKPYYNYLHQVALVSETIPRRNIRILIGDEVGLGKTIEALRIIKYLITIEEAKKILIIAPRSLIRQWLYYEFKDLLHAPRIIRRLSGKNIESLMFEENIWGEHRPLILLAPMDLVKRGSIDRHKHGPFKPYYDFISSVKWDLVVIDEAHHIGFTRSRASLRTVRLSPICVNAKHLILLSATPSRGTHRDMLGRISLLIPEVSKYIKILENDPAKLKRLYEVLSDYLIYRRVKEHVNKLENKEIFTRLTSFIALIRLDRYRELYEELSRFLGLLLRSMDPKSPALLKVIVLKRALSSPYAFLKTFSKIVEGRAVSQTKASYNDLSIEKDPDKLIETELSKVLRHIPEELREKTSYLLTEFEKLYEEGDPGFKALAYLLYYVIVSPEFLPRELRGDYIVFSEYKDTVKYLYDKIIRFFVEKGFVIDENIRSKIVNETLKRFREKEFFEKTYLKYKDLLEKSLTILSKIDKTIFIAKISSENQEIAYLIPDIIEVIENITPKVLKILISTDIASEGLNLQQFNIVVNYDISWSPIRRDQRIGRVYRLRQRRDCVMIDFIRDTMAEYVFYTKLLYKLLNIIEQSLVSRPIEGVLELYITRRQPGGEEHLYLSEKTVGLALAELYEWYYGGGEDLETSVDMIYRELLEKLKIYKDLVENLTSKYDLDRLKDLVEDITGCSSHEEFRSVISQALEKFFNEKTEDPARALREFFEKTYSAPELPHNVVLLVDEPGFEEGYLGIIDLMIDNKIRYSLPIAIVIQRDGFKPYWGLKVLKWLTDLKDRGKIHIISGVQSLNVSDTDMLYKYVLRLGKRLEQDFNSWIKNKEMRLKEFIPEFIGFTGSLEVRLRDRYIRIIGAQNIEEYEIFVKSLSEDLRRWMEEVSINYVAKIYEEKGCIVLEKNIGVYKPYDLLIRCPDHPNLYVEVKSHLKNLLVAELTDSETKFAEEHPHEYIVCDVMGLENKDPNSWMIICGLYADLPKELIITTREEKRARIYFRS